MLDATEVHFVLDTVEIQPQQAVAAFTGGILTIPTHECTLSLLLSWTAVQSSSAVQPTNVVEAAVHYDVSQIASRSGGDVLPHSPIFHSITDPLGSCTDIIHKLLPIYYSFVLVQIRLSSLFVMC